jgi:tyrosyl-tRNA synthetase
MTTLKPLGAYSSTAELYGEAQAQIEDERRTSQELRDLHDKDVAYWNGQYLAERKAREEAKERCCSLDGALHIERGKAEDAESRLRDYDAGNTCVLATENGLTKVGEMVAKIERRLREIEAKYEKAKQEVKSLYAAEIIAWELDAGELGLSVDWGNGQKAAWYQPCNKTVKDRLCALAPAKTEPVANSKSQYKRLVTQGAIKPAESTTEQLVAERVGMIRGPHVG